MTRFRVVCVLFVVAIMGALSTGRGLFWAFAGTLLMLIVLPIVWAWTGVNWVRIARRTFSRVAQAGQILEEEFRLTNLSQVPKLWVEVRDQSTLPNHYASRVIGLLGGKQWRGWRERTRCDQRGRWALGPVTIKSGDPLGIFQMQKRIGNITTLLVYPATYAFRDFPLPALFMPGGAALRRRTHYVTTNAAGVRDYVTGDSINRIHWPTSVRRQRLIVKEFELDPMSDVWIAVDLFALAQTHLAEDRAEDTWRKTGHTESDQPASEFRLPPDTEEYAISIAASAAQHFLQQGRVVGLIAYGKHREIVSAERGERQHTKIMETLAVVRAQGELPFSEVLASETFLLPRSTTLIAISASQDKAWAAAVGHAVRSGLRVVTIVVDAQSFGATSSSDDTIVALAEGGAIVRVVRYGESIPAAIEHDRR